MNTQQLESFVQVAENLSFARAAEALNITQSAVSRQIRSLEEELDTRLLNRSTRAVALTPAGIIFLSDAKEILMKLQLSEKKLKSHSNSGIELLTVGCINESYLSLLTPLLNKCREQFPEIHLFFRTIPFRAVFNLFVHDEIDILFGFKDDLTAPEGFCYCELAQIPVCFAMDESHRFAKKEQITEALVLTDRLVICNSYELPGTVTEMQAQLSHKFSPDRINYCDNIQTFLTLIRAGFGIGLLPEIPSAADVAFVPVDSGAFLSYGVFYRIAAVNPVTEKFLSLLKIK